MQGIKKREISLPRFLAQFVTEEPTATTLTPLTAPPLEVNKRQDSESHDAGHQSSCTAEAARSEHIGKPKRADLEVQLIQYVVHKLNGILLQNPKCSEQS